MAIIGRRFLTAAPTLTAPIRRAPTFVGGAAISSQDLAIFNTTFTGGANGPTGRIYGLREQYGTGTVVAGGKVTKGIGNAGRMGLFAGAKSRNRHQPAVAPDQHRSL